MVKEPIKGFESILRFSDLFDIESECGEPEGFYGDSASAKSSIKLHHLYRASTKLRLPAPSLAVIKDVLPLKISYAASSVCRIFAGASVNHCSQSQDSAV